MTKQSNHIPFREPLQSHMIMSSLKRLSELATQIQLHTSEIEQYLLLNGEQAPSFDVGSPFSLDLPPPLELAREHVLDAMEQLHASLLGPLPFFMRLTSPSVNIFNSLHVIYRFRVAQNLAVDETITYTELARRCGLDPSDLRRFLRLAIAHHVFCEPVPDTVRHNATSHLIISIPGLWDWIGLVCEEMLPSSVHSVEAMTKWPGSEDTSHTGFAIKEPSAQSIFDVIGADPRRASRFANGMTLARSAPPLSLAYLVDNLNWTGDSCPKTVVDVGGSSGSVARALLQKFPSTEQVVVQDLPGVIASATVPPELVDKLRFEEYNFFQEQELQGHDMYLFRHILHDWPDEKAVIILKNQIPALKPGARIILNEICLPPPGVLTGYQEQFLRGFDLSMKHINNGKERDRDEWRTLIRLVDERLVLQDIISPPGSLLSIIEVLFDPARVSMKQEA